MIDIYYYLGIFFIIDTLVSLLTNKDLEKNHEKFNEYVSDVQNNPPPVNLDIKTSSKKGKYNIITTFIFLAWTILGIIFSNHRIFFVFLLALSFTIPFIVGKTKRIKLSYTLGILINICIVLIILYKHFNQ